MQMSALALCGLAGALPLMHAAGQENVRSAQALARLPQWINSVVLITVHCPGGLPPEMGAGVVINDSGYVLTAAHVGSSCLSNKSARMGRVSSPYRTPGEELEATLIERRANGIASPDLNTVSNAISEDLALWRINAFNTSGLAAAKLAERFQLPGDAISVVGFTALPFSYYNNPHNQQPGLTINRLSLISVAARADESPYRLHYSGSTLPGVSGGPVFDDDGRLIGIHSARVTQVISKLIEVGCEPDVFNNCAIIDSTTGGGGERQLRTVGVSFSAVKKVLDNYSWATSIHVVPKAWLSRP